jgi:hypothetical protein
MLSGMKRLLAVALLELVLLGVVNAQGTTYSTNFPLTENPISEGGRWVGGATAGGNLWGNVRTTPGLAFGVSEPTQFGDPTAILTGSWGPSQTVQATVRINTTPTGTCCHEAEVRLRTTISSNSITGYEVYCSVMPNNPYCHIASWGGPSGVWTNLDGPCGGGGAPSLYLVNGDVLKGTVNGTNPVTITLYVNGTQRAQVTDTGNCTFNGDNRKHGPWTTGNPGLGFYDNQDNNWSQFGFSSFSATDGGAPAPSPPSNLRITGLLIPFWRSH